MVRTELLLLIVLDLIGLVAFAYCGAVAALRAGLAVFGVAVIGAVHALGGGFVRDLALNEGIPVAFTNWWYLPVCVATACCAILARRCAVERSWPVWCADSIGLSVFSITGAVRAWEAGVPFLAIAVLGLINGVAGSVIGDVLIGRVPVNLRTQSYAMASLCGSLVFAIGHQVLLPIPPTAIVIFSAVVVILVRSLTVLLGRRRVAAKAAGFGWFSELESKTAARSRETSLPYR